ncbi:hypothetical protein E4631_20010 [Hymenobacter sp. UV11]|uniref:DUF6122 family protein n=1 Tax=Hymenobacter sp. UV11 TaxID=1849735 RepID=UPI0010604232|nr:DUF6122 family protein [Hymenobacter sp. UV11]TDN36954.1 hypothetical protein A8B98_06060 [Hymenobacter sp. UV11]TFZ64286.1 hypothetical protein E4631_20010 [Hymenobacter sp. UV11]
MVHAFLHLLVPGVVALLFYRPRWQRTWLILAAALLLDVDDVLATPMFDPNRCSINFHPLYTYWAMDNYAFMLLPPVTRVWAVGFLLLMALDNAECLQLGVVLPR